MTTERLIEILQQHPPESEVIIQSWNGIKTVNSKVLAVAGDDDQPPTLHTYDYDGKARPKDYWISDG